LKSKALANTRFQATASQRLKRGLLASAQNTVTAGSRKENRKNAVRRVAFGD
jgi:hypothetical protein